MSLFKILYGAAWLSYGAAWLRYGAAWLSYGAAWLSLWCGVAQLVARRLAVRQARVRFSARHHCREGLPTELSSNEEMKSGPSKWRWITVLYECD
jgi:hypothetical protein